MKKKLPNILLSLCLTAAVTGTFGCTNTPAPSATSNSSVQTQSEKPQGDSKSEASASTASNTEGEKKDTQVSTDSGSETRAESKEYSLLYQRYLGDLYTINSEGTRLSYFDRADIIKRFGEKGYDFENSYFLGALDGVLFVDAFDYFEDNTLECIYALDPVNTEANLIWKRTGYDAPYLLGAEVYNDAFYYVTAGAGKVCREIKVEKDPDSFSFTKVESGHGKALQAIFEEDMINTPVQYTAFGYQSCLTRLTDAAGYLLTRNEDNSVFMVKDNGEATKLRNFPDQWVQFVACSPDYIIYGLPDENYNYTMYRYDIASSSFERLPLDSNVSNRILTFEDGKLYYYIEESEEFGHSYRYVYCFDAVLGKSELLYGQEDIPGLGEDTKPGIDGFKLIDGQIFALAPIDSQYTFAKVDYADGKPVYTSLYCPIRKSNALYYGTVTYFSGDFKCPHCGTVLQRFYEELFQLNPEYSKHADKINAYLADKAAQSGENFGVEASEYSDDECEYHKEYPDRFREEQNYNVFDIVFINDKYMTVDMSGYWYGGGAHGQGLRGQYLFNLETGEPVTVRSLFPGTEEDFKALVAKKVEEDLCRYDYVNNMQPYYASDPEAAYNAAYEHASLDSTFIEFHEDTAYIVFEPYEMGPYAAGFIEIPVSYEELLGEGGLR